MPKGLKYEFAAKPWKYAGPAGWVFVSLPLKMAKEIRTHLQSEEQGWGRLTATACIGTTEWKTAIWFDTTQKTYLLPLKAAVRLKERVVLEQKIFVTIWV